MLVKEFRHPFRWTIIALLFQSAKQVWVVKVISVIFLIASAHVVTALLMEPLMQVVMNLSGGGG